MTVIDYQINPAPVECIQVPCFAQPLLVIWGRYILRGCENTLYEGLGIVENLVVRDRSIIELSDDSLMYHMLPYDLARSILFDSDFRYVGLGIMSGTDR